MLRHIKVVCPVGLRSDGSGLLVSVSRAISAAADMAAEARKLRDEINIHREAARVKGSIIAVVEETEQSATGDNNGKDFVVGVYIDINL